MPKFIREKTHFAGTGRTLPRHPRTWATLIILLLQSCALSPWREQQRATPSANLQEALAAVCLSGEGKGRAMFPRGRYSFSYQALHRVKDKEWALEVDFPLGGSELLTLDYSQLERGQIVPGGGLYRRLQLTPPERATLHALLLQFAKILALQGGHVAPGEHWEWRERDGRLSISLPLPGGGGKAHFSAWQYARHQTTGKAFYRKQHISLGNLELQFFPSSCL